MELTVLLEVLYNVCGAITSRRLFLSILLRGNLVCHSTLTMDDVEKQANYSASREPSIEAGAYEHLNRHSTLQSPEALLLSTNTESSCGDWTGFLAIFGAFFALLCSFGQINAFGTYQSWYANHQLSSHSPSSISWIGSLQLWTFFFMVGYLACGCQCRFRSLSERD